MMTASNSWLAGALLLLIPSLPGVARADAPAAPPPTEEQVQAARVPYREARELHRQGRLKEALDRALDAYKIAATPVTALEAGHLLVEAARLVEARDVVRSVALFAVSPRESEKGREARQEAAALGAALDARIPKVAIAGRPPGLEVILDGKPFAGSAGSDPTAWLGLDPGAHALTVRAGDRPCTTINVTLAEGEARTIDLHDVGATCRVEAAVAPAPEPAPGQPSPPSAAAPRALVAPPGPPPHHDGTSSGWRWAGAIVAGAGVVGVGVGAGVALAAKSNYDSVGAECPARGCSLSAFDVRESARSQADAATVAIAVGAAAVAGGALLFFLAPSSDSGSDPGRVAIGIGLGSARLAVRFP